MDEISFDLESAKRIARATLQVESGEFRNKPETYRNNTKNGTNNNQALKVVSADVTELGMYKCKYVYFDADTVTWVNQTENIFDAYCIIGHVAVDVDNIFSVHLVTLMNEGADEIPVYLFSDDRQAGSGSGIGIGGGGGGSGGGGVKCTGVVANIIRRQKKCNGCDDVWVETWKYNAQGCLIVENGEVTEECCEEICSTRPFDTVMYLELEQNLTSWPANTAHPFRDGLANDNFDADSVPGVSGTGYVGNEDWIPTNLIGNWLYDEDNPDYDYANHTLRLEETVRPFVYDGSEWWTGNFKIVGWIYVTGLYAAGEGEPVFATSRGWYYSHFATIHIRFKKTPTNFVAQYKIEHGTGWPTEPDVYDWNYLFSFADNAGPTVPMDNTIQGQISPDWIDATAVDACPLLYLRVQFASKTAFSGDVCNTATTGAFGQKFSAGDLFELSPCASKFQFNVVYYPGEILP